MIALKVWLLVFAGTTGMSAVAGTSAGVAPHMFQSRAACMVAKRAADGWAQPKCVYTTVVVPK